VVREGVSPGVLRYALKPFTFGTLRERLVEYAEFRAVAGEASGRAEVDRARAAAPPKGLSAPIRERVTVTPRDGPGLTAARAAGATGLSRITARRHLEHLVDAGRAARGPRHGTAGRPYRWTRYRWTRERRAGRTAGRGTGPPDGTAHTCPGQLPCA
jgi:response regulator of citrate/malate metabolism